MKVAFRFKRMSLGLPTVVGGIFVYTGIVKCFDPVGFADNVASFQVLPALMINPVALVLPATEIILGLMLIFGIYAKAASLGTGILSGAFLFLHTQAAFRGVLVTCGCFGSNVPAWMDENFSWWVSFALLASAIRIWWKMQGKTDGSFEYCKQQAKLTASAKM
ncbi:hypothetical protein DB345_05220 [Spartobacteria bacterium LR76]|nr:hypothetical protein DB345_05220 [Spartobacteria bacterium LR76]